MPIPARVAADAQQADTELANMAAAVAAAQNPPAPSEPTPPDPAPAPAAPTPATPVDDATLRRMQAQLDSLQGRYEAAQTRNDQLSNEIQQLRAAPAPAAPAPAPAAAPAPRFTQQQLDEFGEETLAMVQQLAAAQTQPLLDRIDQLQKALAGVEGRTERLQRDTQQVVQNQRKSAGQLYVEALDKSIPGWREVNDDPRFMDWLETNERLSGAKYGDLLQSAHNSLDHARVAAIFTAYKPELANGNPPPAAAPAAPKAPAVDPATLVAPSTSPSSSSPTPPPPGEVYTQSQYDKMMDDKVKKRISPQEFAAFEQKFFAAARDGRVSLTS